LTRTEDTPPALSKVVLDIKRSNCDLNMNFCQFNDLINIENDNFCRSTVEFNPKKTVKEVLEETRELFGCESRFESEKMPSVVLGD